MTAIVEPATTDLPETDPVGDPEFPMPGVAKDLTTAAQIADWALAKLGHYVRASQRDVSSHHIELAVKIGDLFLRLQEVANGTPAEPEQFALEVAEDAQRLAEESKP